MLTNQEIESTIYPVTYSYLAAKAWTHWQPGVVVRKGLALTYAIPLETSEIFGVEMRRRQAVNDTICGVWGYPLTF